MDIVMFFLSSRKHAKQVIRLTLDGGGSDDARIDCNHHCSYNKNSNNMRRQNHNNSSRKRTVDQQIVISPPQVETLTKFGWENFPVVYVSDSLASTPPSTPIDDKLTQQQQVQEQSRAASSASSPSQVTHKKQKKKKNTVPKKVEFVTVQIREHAITVGEHDWCDGRLPLSLDWKHTETKVYHVDYYELVRDRKGRLPRGQLPKLDYYQRQLRLRRVSGYTQHDLEVMEMEAATQHHQRLQQTQGGQQLKKCKTIPIIASAKNDDIKDGMFVPLSNYGNLEASEQ